MFIFPIYVKSKNFASKKYFVKHDSRLIKGDFILMVFHCSLSFILHYMNQLCNRYMKKQQEDGFVELHVTTKKRLSSLDGLVSQKKLFKKLLCFAT